MKVLEINKGDLVYKAEGWSLYETDDYDVQIMEWEDACVGKLAWFLHEMIRRHALSTNGLQRHGVNGIAVKRLELIPLIVVVRSTANDTDISFVDSHGAAVDKHAAKRVPGAKPSRLTIMEDVALHTARSLRAHLAPMELSDLELHLHFGIEPGGACLLQIPNPLECSLGSTDYENICAQLG